MPSELHGLGHVGRIEEQLAKEEEAKTFKLLTTKQIYANDCLPQEVSTSVMQLCVLEHRAPGHAFSFPRWVAWESRGNQDSHLNKPPPPPPKKKKKKKPTLARPLVCVWRPLTCVFALHGVIPHWRFTPHFNTSHGQSGDEAVKTIDVIAAACSWCML